MQGALEFHLEGIAATGEELPSPRSLTYYIENTDEKSNDDIIAHINVEIPEIVLA